MLAKVFQQFLMYGNLNQVTLVMKMEKEFDEEFWQKTT